MKDDKKVKTYFEVGARDFDEIYDWMSGTHDKPLKRMINKLFRKGMVERFELALKEGEPNKTLLDIGCGSGRISLVLAEKGVNVTGIDYSKQMIDLANDYLKKYNEETKQELSVKYFYSNFMEDYESNEKFDITLALGVFDYIKNPRLFHEKMKKLTKEKIIASYPAKYTFQMPIRKVWLWTKKCPVYFYTKKKIRSLYKSAELENFEIIKVSAGYFVKAFVNK